MILMSERVTTRRWSPPSWKEEDILYAGSESKVPVDAGLEQLKAIGSGKVGDRKRVPISRDHRNKRFVKDFSLILIRFDGEGVLRVRKPCDSYK